MTNGLSIAPVLVPLLTGTAALVLRSWPRGQQIASVLGTAVYAGVVGLLIREVVFAPDAAAITYQLGGWRAPFGITLVADGLSVFMLGMTALVAVYAVVFSVRFIDQRNQRVYYHALFQFLLLGATGAFLTGDLFNLFVWFEVMLMTSYVFVAFYGDASHTAAGMRYVVLNIVGSALMLLGVGGLYATTGTLNMADMAQQLSRASGEMEVVVGLFALVFVTFALKAGLVPFQFWVPSAYRAAPLPVVAMFAGVTKKVGIYAIVRLAFTVFGDTPLSTETTGVSGESLLTFVGPMLLSLGALSVLVGGLGALSRDSLDELFAYSSIGQVGFIAIAVGFAASTSSERLRHAAILAGLVFALHHALTKGLLFLSTGIIRDGAGTTRLSNLGGLGERSPGFASVFLVGGLSLVGVPPLVGFFGKLLVFETAANQVITHATGDATALWGALALLAILVLGSVLTILYVTRAWMGTVWGTQTTDVRGGRVDTVEVLILSTLAAIVIAVGLGFEPVYQVADAAAEAALDTESYVEAVDLGGEEA